MVLLPLDLTGFNPLQLVELKLLRFKVSTYEHPFTNDIMGAWGLVAEEAVPTRCFTLFLVFVINSPNFYAHLYR